MPIPSRGPALIVTAHGEVALETWPVPSPDPQQILVETEYSGVSIGTELLAATGKHHGWGDPPFVPGYQAVGRVVGLGDAVPEGAISIGDHVACFSMGTHQRYLVAHAELTHRVEENEYLQCASLFVQPAVGANALNLAGVGTGDTVMVVGQGLIGQATAQLASLRGAYVVATDVSPERLEMSAAHCADRVIDASLGPVSEQIADQFPDGLDVVIESTGFVALVDDAIKCLRKEGTFVFEGYYPGDLAFGFDEAHLREARAVFPCFIGGRTNREGVLRLLSSGRLRMEPLITNLGHWSEATEVYAQLFTEKRDHLNAIVFDWRDAS